MENKWNRCIIMKKGAGSRRMAKNEPKKAKNGREGVRLVYNMNGGIGMGKKSLEDVYRYIRVV